ncbi:MAG: biotin/lipoyl-binding protein [Clostridiales bacterium]|jgi:glutaconyl-CoA decarboxylase|nr:biotin/lipoyl-binding protein [Clostridiales bacterium]
MRKFNVRVNGKSYEVEVDEGDFMTAPSAPVQAPVKSSAAAAPVQKTPVAAAPVQAAKPVATAGGTPVPSPMPGLILKVAVPEGSAVKKGDKLVVLEAMKMENDIVAPADGAVNFAVKSGDSVETGDVLCVIK